MPNWDTKRQQILERDNYTCQECFQFNPELGMVQLIGLDGEIEFHEFRNSPDPYQNVYFISESKSGYSFEFNFGDCWPIFPIMQVHHKRYVHGKEYWDYNEADLITLCKKCHTKLHTNKKIPFFSSDNILIEEKLLTPQDIGSGRVHSYEDWTFIQKVGASEYALSSINPTITMVVFEGENTTQTFEYGKQVLDQLINRFFPLYKRK